MTFSYLELTTIRVMLGLALIYTVLVDIPLGSVVLTLCFIAMHWHAQSLGQQQGLHKYEFQYSSLLSSIILLVVFIVLVARQRIPIVLAAIFVATFIIKMMFMFQDKPMREESKTKPLKTNWSLTASFLFLSCYYFGNRLDLAVVSIGFIVFLVMTIEIYSKAITKSMFVRKKQ